MPADEKQPTVRTKAGEFTLPSGRVVEMCEPTYGEECDVVFAGLNDPKEFHYAKFAAIVPSLTREDIKALNRKDGRALALEVNRLFIGRPEEQEAPFGNGSPSPSTASNIPVET